MTNFSIYERFLRECLEEFVPTKSQTVDDIGDSDDLIPTITFREIKEGESYEN